MTTDELSPALRERFRAAAPVIEVDASGIVRRGRARRRARWAGAGSAVAGVLVAVVAVTGYGGQRRQEVAAPPPEPPAAVSLWLSAEEVPPGAEMVAVPVGDPAVPVEFGVAVYVDRWMGDRWASLGGAEMCLDHWFCTATFAPTDGSLGVHEISIGLGVPQRFTTAGLEPGWYRLNQTGYGGLTVRGVFEVSVDAAEPAPLAPTNTASISVRPVLVESEGETVTLTLLVPPQDEASQSVEDIAAATEGLAGDVTVERWTQQRWETVVRLPVTDPPGTDPAMNQLADTVEIPPLAAGAYRLVREGPAGSHYGSFWVPADASVEP